MSEQFKQFNNPQHFEVHVTIYPTKEIELFKSLCNDFTEYANTFKEFNNVSFENANCISCKPIIIVLPQGNFSQQPMCSTYIWGTLIQAVKYGELFSEYIVKNSDYKVSRNKVEARLRNVDDSINLDPKQEFFEGKYWEFHTKLRFTSKTNNSDSNSDLNLNSKIEKDNSLIDQENMIILDKNIDSFRKTLMSNFPNCRLSKSALSNFDKLNTDSSTRIVTLRIYSGTKKNALENLESLIKFLNDVKSDYQFELRDDIEKELSVYDSNVKHDLGWISMIDADNKSQSKLLDNKNMFQKFLFLFILSIFVLLSLLKLWKY